MNEEIRRVLLRALDQYQGDDLARARLAFRGQSPVQMQEQYGQSGMTKAQMLAHYEAHNASVEKARAYVKAAR